MHKYATAISRSVPCGEGVAGIAREALEGMSTMASEMILAVGLEAIGQGIGAQDRAVWQVQIGVTRVGAGGRAMPRCRNGRMTNLNNLVASIVEPEEAQELVSLPCPVRKPAPLARAIVFLAVSVVVRDAARREFSMLAAIARAIWHALVPARRMVTERARAAWQAAREMGIERPSIWRATSATSA